MKLSEAILKGCEIAPEQAYGDYFFNGGTAACALGAAVIASVGSAAGYYKAAAGAEQIIEDATGVNVYRSRIRHHRVHRSLNEVIVYMNDKRRWSRERIASVLESAGY